MQKYIPIIRNEFINIKWLMLLMIFFMYIFGIKQYETILSTDFYEFINISQYSDLSIMYPLIEINNIAFIFILVYLQFNAENKPFILSLPYKKNEILTVKLLCGVFCYSIVFVIYTLMIIPIYNKYSFLLKDLFITVNVELGNYLSISNLILSIFCVWMFFTMIYVIMVFFQTLIKNSIMGVIVGVFAIIFPSNFIYLIRRIFSLFTEALTFNSYYYLDLLAYIYPSYKDIIRFTDESQYESGNIQLIYISNALWKAGLFLIIMIILLALTFMLYKKEQQIYSNSILTFKWEKIPFITIATLEVSTFSGLYALYTTENKFIIIIVMIVFAFIGFFVSKKFIDITSSSLKRRRLQ